MTLNSGRGRWTDERPIQPWDSDHTALVHVLWAAQRKGLTLDKADDLAQWIMTSRWMKATRLHAQAPAPDEQAIERARKAAWLASSSASMTHQEIDLIVHSVLAAALEQPE